MRPIVLASASPRRQELLRQVGVPFEVIVSPTPEEPWRGGDPAWYALAQARLKADAVAVVAPHAPAIVGADTVVLIDDEVLGKPRDRDDAARMLRRLSGRGHHVITGFRALVPGGRAIDQMVMTRVLFRALTLDEIEGYLDTREWDGKAGGYAIQGLAGAFIPEISGSYPNVVGLPVVEVVSALRELKVLPHFPVRAPA